MRVLKSSLIFFVYLNLLGGALVSNASEKIIEEISKCPKSPNCVSTLTESLKHKMNPWELLKEDTLEKIKMAALKEPRSKLISGSDTHLQFTFKSFIFRFVDDLWFAVKDGKVHFKSAARTGYRDFNKNKERLERIKDRVYK